MVAYVCSHRDSPPGALAEDATDALLIVRALKGLLDRQELVLIRLGRAGGLTWATLAGPLGVRSRQGAEQRALRLEGSVQARGRQEALVRLQHTREPAEADWLAQQKATILVLGRAFAASTFAAVSITDAADELAQVLADPDPRPRVILAWISHILRELARDDDIATTLPPPVREHAARMISDWDPLRPPP